MFLESAIETRQENKRKSMGESNGVIEFNRVTEGCTKSDICRFFLASLCLANSGNVKIEEAEGFSEYRFEVLSGKVDKPMETYRAPSAAAAANS